MNKIIQIMVLSVISILMGCKSSNDPSKWSDKKVDKWFSKGEWLAGWNVKPDETIDRRAFALSYFQNKDRWYKAFLFLKDHDFTSMELKRYDIDGDNLYATLSEYYSKKPEIANYEAHKKYIDIQYVVKGKEQIGIAGMDDMNEIIQPYDASKDIMFMSVRHVNNFEAGPGKFFIFFPDDLHKPGLREGDSTLVRKIVVKVKAD